MGAALAAALFFCFAAMFGTRNAAGAFSKIKRSEDFFKKNPSG